MVLTRAPLLFFAFLCLAVSIVACGAHEDCAESRTCPREGAGSDASIDAASVDADADDSDSHEMAPDANGVEVTDGSHHDALGSRDGFVLFDATPDDAGRIHNWPAPVVAGYDCFAEPPTGAFIRAVLKTGDPSPAIYTGGAIEPGHYVLTNVGFWTCSHLQNFGARWTMDIVGNEMWTHADEKVDMVVPEASAPAEFKYGQAMHWTTSGNTLFIADYFGCYGVFYDDETYYYTFDRGQLTFVEKTGDRACIELQFQKQ